MSERGGKGGTAERRGKRGRERGRERETEKPNLVKKTNLNKLT
jgi:hypothetical protein